jgi:hypothetical protein
MQRFLVTAIAITLGWLIALTAARADWATPFAEINNKVGDVSEAHGYVVTTAENEDGPFMVIVTTDTMQSVAILARADKSAVPVERIGRWSIIKAKVVKAPTGNQATDMELQILSVRSTKPAAATQAK